MRRRFITKVSDYLKANGEKEKSTDYVLKLDSILRDKDTKAMFGKTTTTDFSTKLNIVVKHTTNNITVETKDTMKKVSLCWTESSTNAIIVEQGSMSQIETGVGTWLRIGKAPKLDFEEREFVGNREESNFVERLEETLKKEPFRTGQVSTKIVHLVVGACGFDKISSSPTQDYAMTVSVVPKEDVASFLRFQVLDGILLPFGYIIAGTNVVGLKYDNFKKYDLYLKDQISRAEKTLIDPGYASSVVYMENDTKKDKKKRTVVETVEASVEPFTVKKKPGKLDDSRRNHLITFLEHRMGPPTKVFTEGKSLETKSVVGNSDDAISVASSSAFEKEGW